MSTASISEVIEAIYAAAVDEAVSWHELGAFLCTLLEAQDVTLGLPGRVGNVLMPTHPLDALYVVRYRPIDPYFAAALRLPRLRAGSPESIVRLGHELVPEHVLLRSEFHVDYSKPRGRRYMIGSLLDDVDGVSPISAHREAGAGPFGEHERQIMFALRPHLSRALNLRQRLSFDRGQIGAAALDTLPVPVLVVDAGLRVRYLNEAAHTLAARPESGVSLVREGPIGGGDLALTVGHKDDHRQLSHRVAAACAGGEGGALKLRARADRSGALTTLAAFVAPLDTPGGTLGLARPLAIRARGTAMVVIRDTAAVAAPGAPALIDLFGLTGSEAEVAIALAGGATAEDVAASRRVSLGTVRSQVRAILRKTDAASLRDFERLVAITFGLHPNTPKRS